MTKVEDMTKAFKDMMGAFPIDTSALDTTFKNAASLNEQFAQVAVNAAEQSNVISSNWTKDTLAKMSEMTKAKEDPADYAKAIADFTTGQAEVASKNLAAFAEVAQKVQADTVQLLMEAGRTLSAEAAATGKKATFKAAKAAK